MATARECVYGQAVGDAFGIGNTTARALIEGAGRAGERDNGNGSLMRTVPLAFTEATDA